MIPDLDSPQLTPSPLVHCPTHLQPLQCLCIVAQQVQQQTEVVGRRHVVGDEAQSLEVPGDLGNRERWEVFGRLRDREVGG